MKTRIIALVVGLVLFVSGWALAQARQFRPIEPVQPPVVVSSSDFGFRIEGKHGDIRIGKLVVRIDGQWVDAILGGGEGGLRPITTR
jgi:hypothetical protein